jgi:tetratricopeptide (TPR) repeat protein/anti-sigma factor RsiW
MLDEPRLIAYVAGTLDPEERARLEAELATDRSAQRLLAEQQLMDQALRVALGGARADERVKQSILAVVRGMSVERLRAQVLEHTVACPPTSVRTRSGWLGQLSAWAETVRGGLKRQTEQASKACERLTGSLSRRIALAAVSAVLLLAGGFLWQRAWPARVEVGKFAVVVGKPQVHRGFKRSTLPLRSGTTLWSGDRIETGDADKAEIQFHDGTTLRLSFNTTLEIPRFKAPRANAPALSRPSQVNLLLGQVWAKVQKTTNQAQFAVYTPVATAAVKGTEFGLKLQKAPSATLNAQRSTLNAPLQAVLTVKEGSVIFSNPFGKVEATDLTESVATSNTAPTPPKRVASLKAIYVRPQLALVITTSRPTLPAAGYRLVHRAGWAGLDVADVSPANSAQGTNPGAASQQVRVVRVQRNSPAEQAGLRVGDVILAVDGRPTTNAWQVAAALFKGVGTLITLTVANEPAPRVVTLTTTAAPDAPPLPPLSRASAIALDTAGRLLLDRRSDEGERALQQLLGTEASAAAHNDLGLLYETKDDLAEALAHYQAAVATAPQVALYHFNYGMALQNIGNLERAAEELELATTLAPSWGEAFQSLAEVCSPLERHADALRAVDAALSMRPQSPDLWVSRGRVMAEQDRSGEARQALLKALELETNYAAACRDLGDLCHHEDQLDEAEQLLRKAIELDPSDVGAFNILGNIYTSGGHYAEAEQALREAIRLDPAYALAYSNLGYVYRRGGQTAEAEKMYLKAIELDPDSPIAYTNLGELYRRLGRLDEAERLLRAGFELDPLNAMALNNLAGLYHYNRRQFDEAEKTYRRAIELFPSFPYPYGNLGNLLLERGKLDEAEKMYHKTLELIGDKPESVVTWVSLGKLCEKRGDPAAAIQAYRKALALRPDLPAAKEALQRLGQ